MKTGNETVRFVYDLQGNRIGFYANGDGDGFRAFSCGIAKDSEVASWHSKIEEDI